MNARPQMPRRRFVAGSAAVALGMTRFGGTAAQVPVGKDLIVRTETPLNAEPRLTDLVGSWLTPERHFYVRSHAPAPKIDLDNYRLEIGGLVERPLTLSLAELARMPQVETTATLTCAGNRRAELNAVRPTGGVLWDAGTVGNATWSGVPLAALLRRAGVKEGAEHVWFDGLDRHDHEGREIVFGASIPLLRATAESPPTLVATTMNGVPLPPDHGFPLRTVVPGYIGARSVKWLGRITVADRPSPNHYVATAYKLVTDRTDLAWQEAGPIYRYRLNSAICRPSAGAGGPLRVEGYALPPGDGRTVAKVELSLDDGATWQPARITSDNRPYCWVLWQADVAVTPQARSLLVRATDALGLSQPRTVPWNAKGYLQTGWHRIALGGS